MDKLLISRNKAIKLLDTSYFIFTNEIEPELEFVSIGARNKIVLKSLYDFIDRVKHKPSTHIPVTDVAPSLCSFINNKAKIIL